MTDVKRQRQKQFQGAGRRFRADIWMDEKVSARTMYALQERGIKVPPGTNVRGTRDFKDECKRQLSKFRQEQAAEKEAKRAARQAERQEPAAEESTQ